MLIHHLLLINIDNLHIYHRCVSHAWQLWLSIHASVILCILDEILPYMAINVNKVGLHDYLSYVWRLHHWIHACTVKCIFSNCRRISFMLCIHLTWLYVVSSNKIYKKALLSLVSTVLQSYSIWNWIYMCTVFLVFVYLYMIMNTVNIDILKYTRRCIDQPGNPVWIMKLLSQLNHLFCNPPWVPFNAMHMQCFKYMFLVLPARCHHNFFWWKSILGSLSVIFLGGHVVQMAQPSTLIKMIMWLVTSKQWHQVNCPDDSHQLMPFKGKYKLLWLSFRGIGYLNR